MHRIWTACNILGIKADQFRGVSHQKDIAFVSDTIFRCIALGLNCDYMTFYRTDVNIGRKFLKIELGAVICVQGVKEVDTPPIQWCYSRNIHLPRAYREDQSDRGDTTRSITLVIKHFLYDFLYMGDQLKFAVIYKTGSCYSS